MTEEEQTNIIRNVKNITYKILGTKKIFIKRKGLRIWSDDTEEAVNDKNTLVQKIYCKPIRRKLGKKGTRKTNSETST